MKDVKGGGVSDPQLAAAPQFAALLLDRLATHV
jgi:hypothetical protein